MHVIGSQVNLITLTLCWKKLQHTLGRCQGFYTKLPDLLKANILFRDTVVAWALGGLYSSVAFWIP